MVVLQCRVLACAASQCANLGKHHEGGPALGPKVKLVLMAWTMRHKALEQEQLKNTQGIHSSHCLTNGLAYIQGQQGALSQLKVVVD